MIAKLNKSITDYSVYILDMDGTLYYQLPVQLSMAWNLAVYYTIHFLKIKELFVIWKFRKLREKGEYKENDNFEEQQYQLLSEKFNMEVSMVREIIRFWMYERPLKCILRYKDKELIRLIKSLRDKGAKIAVYSDYPVDKKLKVLDLIVDYQFSSSDENIMCLKPDAKGIRRIVEVINEPINSMVFIGDRDEKDGICARAVGMDFCILKKDYFKRKQQFKNLLTKI